MTSPSAERTRNIFVVGLDDEHHAMLRRLRGAERCRFHPLLTREEVRGVEEFSVDEWLERARRILDAFDRPVDGIISYWDFPIMEMVAILAAEYELPMAKLDALARLQHKYWSRTVQLEVAPECVPAFEAIDPFDDESLRSISLEPPYWLKPVRSFRSHLGFRIRHGRDLREAIRQIREELPRLASPYEKILTDVTLPPEVERVGTHACVAEGIVSGRQVTLEGWSWGGEVEVYGAVDSVREANRTTFARYQYPSRLPRAVLDRMTSVVREVVGRTGYTDAAFNAELFWDRARERIWLLEINTRASESHFDLFEKVDGLPHAQVVLDVALDRRPAFPRREGRWPMAAKCFVRHFGGDAVVTRAPTPTEVAEIEEELPGVSIRLAVREGDRLSELPDQDAYSFELGSVFVGAGSERAVRERFRECTARLPLELEEVGLAERSA